MNIIVVGLNHKTAPIEIREKLAFDTTETIKALRTLTNRFPQAEFILLSTCNRVELYCAAELTENFTPENLIDFLAEDRSIPADKFRDFLYIHHDRDAVEHLLTVASSLDSLVVGEAQIIAQVKESYRLACTAKSAAKILNRLFHYAFSTSKKVYTATSIATGRVSIAGVAIELAMQLFADLKEASVVIIGAGEMGELVLQHLLHEGCRDVTIVNRSFDRAQEMAQRYGVNAKQWESLEDQLLKADIAVAAAAVQDYLFTKDTFKRSTAKRRKDGLLIVDIAVPRNFDPEINQIDNVYLYSVDDLSGVAEHNRKARHKDIEKGMKIIYRSIDEFLDWFKAMDIGPLIGTMKHQFSKIGKDELKRFFRRNSPRRPMQRTCRSNGTPYRKQNAPLCN